MKQSGDARCVLLVVGAIAVLLAHIVAWGQTPDRGFLDVSSEPRAQILVDDWPTGAWTPTTLALRPGHHKLTLVRREGRPRSYGVMVEARQTTRVKIHLAD